jgi:lysylphosphatidylglycerol synthetase-like protein (DUF2156 family)
MLAELPIAADTERLARTAWSIRWTAAFVYLAATLTALVTIIIPLAFSSSPATATCVFRSHLAAQRYQLTSLMQFRVLIAAAVIAFCWRGLPAWRPNHGRSDRSGSV